MSYYVIEFKWRGRENSRDFESCEYESEITDIGKLVEEFSDKMAEEEMPVSVMFVERIDTYGRTEE